MEINDDGTPAFREHRCKVGHVYRTLADEVHPCPECLDIYDKLLDAIVSIKKLEHIREQLSTRKPTKDKMEDVT